MRVSRTRVAVGEDFTLTIHARVRERIAALDELVIPDVGTMHVLGDERRAASSAGGTDIDEVLTIEPAEGGTFTLPGASLDAIDARTGKPTRFSANSVRIVVGGNAPAPWLRVAAAIVLGVALATMAALVAWRALARRAVAAPEPVVAPPSVASPRDDVRRALAYYRSAPTGDALSALRAALFFAAGTNAGATVGDAAKTTGDDRLIAALRAADAATFADPALRDEASRVAQAVDAWLQ